MVTSGIFLQMTSWTKHGFLGFHHGILSHKQAKITQFVSKIQTTFSFAYTGFMDIYLVSSHSSFIGTIGIYNISFASKMSVLWLYWVYEVKM